MSLHGQRSPPHPELVMTRVFQDAVTSHPDSPALADVLPDAPSQEAITFSLLNHKANVLARVLLRRLVGTPCANPDGDRIVAVCMAPSAQLVITLLAIHKAGAAYLPLDVSFPESRVVHILQDARVALLVAHGRPSPVQAAHASPQLENNVHIVHLEDLKDEMTSTSGENMEGGELDVVVTSASTAMVLYTSGSTGLPKGVRLSHAAVMNRLSWQWTTFPYYPDEVCCFKTALTFVDSVSEVFGPLLNGRKLVVIPKNVTQDVDELVTVLDRERVGRLVLVPTLLRAILLYCEPQDSPKLTHLRLWVCSGEVFPSDLLHVFFQVFTKGQTICNFYGSTEVMGDVTYAQFADAKDVAARLVTGNVPIGTPLSNCCIYLLDADLRQVGSGQLGEVFAAGANLANGYVGGAQPDKFITNPHSEEPEYSVLYRTGDFGRLMGGQLIYEGRTDSQVKIRGHRVDLSEVQAAIQKVEGVDKTYVLCYKPGEVTQALVAFYTNHDEERLPATMKGAVAAFLPPYMQPQLVSVKDIPLLVNGKVDRQQLIKIYEAKATDAGKADRIDLKGVEPGQEIPARMLLQTVARVLGPACHGPTLGLSTHFFQAGGNSLNAVLTVTSLRDLGYHIGIGQFLKAETLGDVLLQLTRVQVDTEKTHMEDEDMVHTSQYTCIQLDDQHRDNVIRMISKSFSKRGDLEQWLETEEWEYDQFLSQMWSDLVEQQLSFVVVETASAATVAVALNMDLYREPHVEQISPKIKYIFDFLEDCEAPVRRHLPDGKGSVVHSFMMATAEHLGGADNVRLIQLMEVHNLELAATKGFKALFTTNTNELTQHVCDDLLSYKVFADCPVNTWTATDGSKPFANAPDSQRAVCTAKFM